MANLGTYLGKNIFQCLQLIWKMRKEKPVLELDSNSKANSRISENLAG